jgi:heme-degrading monooxygenase HmoA
VCNEEEHEMPTTTDPEGRTAHGPDSHAAQPVTLMNRFIVSPERDEEFVALWTQTSAYFRAQPGFLSLRLHRAVSPDAEHRFVNVANWATLQDFRAAHDTDEFRAVVGQEGWSEFPSSPSLYEVIVTAEAGQ